jgi:hypothetical protein
MTRFSLLLVVALFGCKEGDAAKAKPAGPTKLPKLGLQVDVPGAVEIGDAIMGEGHMLQGGSIGAMQVEIAQKAQTLDEAKSDSELYSPKNVKSETLADGWTLTYENTGSMGKNYFVEVRRDLGGKTYMCSTTGGDAKQAAAVLAACKTLRP